ncbi:MAG: radical SAM protein, partial [Planctomycetota bacterium]
VARVLEEINILLDNGYKEIIISGIHLGCYGKDLKDGTNLAKLIEKFDRFASYDFRFRLSSIEVHEIDEELLSVLKRNKNFCHHFHLPLQSGSDRILRLMNRRYTKEEFLTKIIQLKENFNNPAFSTDVIVGFPSEEEQDFEQTIDICRRTGFFKIHIFPYSDRLITRSSTMPFKCAPHTIKQRCQKLLAVEKENMQRCYTQYLNMKCRILVEKFIEKERAYFGYTDKYLKTLVYSNNGNLHNKFIDIIPTVLKEGYLIAEHR